MLLLRRLRLLPFLGLGAFFLTYSAVSWLDARSYLDFVLPGAIRNTRLNNIVIDDDAGGDWSAVAEIPSLNTTAGEAWVSFKDVSVDNPKVVVVLSYQRCGSTLLGHLFNSNDNIFYQFEPLDSLYSSLYGTPYGWNVPSDITHHKNGTRREVPTNEVNHVTNFLRRLMMCDFDTLPTEALVHIFQLRFSWQYRSSSTYIKCLSKQATEETCNSTSQQVYRFCGQRFGAEPTERIEQCRQLMSKDDDSSKDLNVSRATRKLFQLHHKCMNSVRETVNKHCIQFLQSSCRQRTTRAVKVVRATMKSMRVLLPLMENLRILHLVRDPRGVTLSRFKMNWSLRGLYANGTDADVLVNEAQQYCQTVVDDILDRKALEHRYPGRIIYVVYEDLVANLRNTVEKIYEFLDLPMNDVEKATEALRMMVTPIKSKKLKTSVESLANKWQTELPQDVVKRIYHVCNQFYALTEHKWNFDF